MTLLYISTFDYRFTMLILCLQITMLGFCTKPNIKYDSQMLTTYVLIDCLVQARARLFFSAQGSEIRRNARTRKKLSDSWVNKKIFKVFIILICVMKTSCDATVKKKNTTIAKTTKQMIVLNDSFCASTEWCDLLWNSVWRSPCVQVKYRRNKNKFFFSNCVKGSNTLQRSIGFSSSPSLPLSFLPSPFCFLQVFLIFNVSLCGLCGMEKLKLIQSKVGLQYNGGVSQHRHWL